MSLDIYLMVDDSEVFSANITHNLNKMAAAAGIYQAMWRPEELNISIAGDLIPILEKGVMELIKYPTHYKQWNPENAWGDYAGLVRVASEYLGACSQNPNAIIHVSR